MNIPEAFSADMQLKDKILFVLSKLHRATPDQVAMEIMELQGTASEEGVAELIITVTQAMNELQHEGVLKGFTEEGKQTRYTLTQDNQL